MQLWKAHPALMPWTMDTMTVSSWAILLYVEKLERIKDRIGR